MLVAGSLSKSIYPQSCKCGRQEGDSRGSDILACALLEMWSGHQFPKTLDLGSLLLAKTFCEALRGMPLTALRPTSTCGKASPNEEIAVIGMTSL